MMDWGHDQFRLSNIGFNPSVYFFSCVIALIE